MLWPETGPRAGSRGTAAETGRVDRPPIARVHAVRGDLSPRTTFGSRATGVDASRRKVLVYGFAPAGLDPGPSPLPPLPGLGRDPPPPVPRRREGGRPVVGSFPSEEAPLPSRVVGLSSPSTSRAEMGPLVEKIPVSRGSAGSGRSDPYPWRPGSRPRTAPRGLRPPRASERPRTRVAVDGARRGWAGGGGGSGNGPKRGRRRLLHRLLSHSCDPSETLAGALCSVGEGRRLRRYPGRPRPRSISLGAP